MSTHNPHSVLESLKEQAQYKASIRMFYSAAELLRDYKGPYAQETAEEREKLASEYHEMAKAAEEARWGGDGSVPTPLPPRSITPPAPRPATPSKPKPATPRPSSRPATPASAKPPTPRAPKAPEYQLDGDNMILACRWCKEQVSVPVAQAGKFAPCPKCDELLKVPALQK